MYQKPRVSNRHISFKFSDKIWLLCNIFWPGDIIEMAGNISGIISALRPLQMASNAGSISMQQCHHMLSSVKNTIKLI